MSLPKKIRAKDLISFKQLQQTITCLTAYDYRTAQLIDKAGIDLILIGDSLANTFLGLDNTYQVSLQDMIYHTQAVSRGAHRALVVTDMPFGTYQVSVELTIQNAIELVRAGAEALKLEGGSEYICTLIQKLTENGIPIIGHIGYTPQSTLMLGVGKIQGKSQTEAQSLVQQAQNLEQAGASAIVLELMPADLAESISQSISIPTIGIGSGKQCDGQILVSDDLLGKYEKQFSFVKQYANLSQIMEEAFSEYAKDVQNHTFPE